MEKAVFTFQPKPKTSNFSEQHMAVAGQVADILGSKSYSAFSKEFAKLDPRDYPKLIERARWVASKPDSEIRTTRKQVFFGGNYKQKFLPIT